MDVELVTKSKKAKTLKSGTTGSASSAPEKPVQELLAASEWWSEVVNDYFKCAVQAKLLAPKMEETIQKLQEPDFVLSEGGLNSLLEDAETYRKNLRKGSADEFEFQLFKVVESQVEMLIALGSADEVKQHGWGEMLPGLEKALGLLSSQLNANTLKDKLQTWHSGLRGQFAQQAFKDLMTRFLADRSLDWTSLAKAFTAIQGSDTSAFLDEWNGIFALMFEDVREKVGLRRRRRRS